MPGLWQKRRGRASAGYDNLCTAASPIPLNTYARSVLDRRIDKNARREAGRTVRCRTGQSVRGGVLFQFLMQRGLVFIGEETGIDAIARQLQHLLAREVQ